VRTPIVFLRSALLLIPIFCAPLASSSDSKHLAEAQALIDRAETISNLTGPNAVPFFLEVRFDRSPTLISGRGGTYKLWWVAADKWRAEAQSGDLTEIEIRNDQGLWLRADTDPKLDAVFSGAHRFPFGGNLLAWSEKIVGLRERKLGGTKLSCVETEREGEQRELCFDPQAGMLIRTTALIPLRTSSVLRQPEPMELITDYREYSGVGDKSLPGEIQTTSKGQVTASIRLIRVALQPRTPFVADMFAVPTGYRRWPGCDQYQAARFSKNFWRQTPGVLDHSWFTNAGHVADGVRITVGPDGKPEEVQLINPVGKPSKQVQSVFMNQTYEPAVCDGKTVVGMLSMDFTRQ